MPYVIASLLLFRRTVYQGVLQLEPNGTAAKYKKKSIGSKPKRKFGASNAEEEIAMNISKILLRTS